MTYRRTATCTLAAIALLVGVSACGGSGDSSSSQGASGGGSSLPFSTLEKGTLTVAFTDGNLPQLALQNGQIVGMDAFWIKKFAAKYGLKIKPVPTTFDGELLGVQTNKYDVGTTAYWTPERAKTVYYTGPEYFDPVGILTLNNFSYGGPASLKGKDVGTLSGYAFAPYMNKYYGAGHVKLFSEISQGLQALASGQISGWIDGVARVAGEPNYKKRFPNIVAHRLPSNALGMPDYIINATSYNYVNCKNKPLAKAMDDVLKGLLADKSYETNAKKYSLVPALNSPDAPKVPQEGC